MFSFILGVGARSWIGWLIGQQNPSGLSLCNQQANVHWALLIPHCPFLISNLALVYTSRSKYKIQGPHPIICSRVAAKPLRDRILYVSVLLFLNQAMQSLHILNYLDIIGKNWFVVGDILHRSNDYCKLWSWFAGANLTAWSIAL